MAAEQGSKSDLSPYEARFAAQRIAFGPLMFQAARVLRERGLLAALDAAGPEGLDAAALSESGGLSSYAAGLLLEAGLELDLVRLEGDRFLLTETGRCLARDPMTRVNMDFVQELCYRGFSRLDEALATGEPAGLREFGSWRTLYEALPELPERARDSWHAFDHYYSSGAARAARRIVFDRRPARLLDVGGNDGRWAVGCLEGDPRLEVTILDYPAQCERARAHAAERGVAGRLHTVGAELADHDRPFPGPFDAVWMSQLLSCFSAADCVALLGRAAAALAPGGVVWILENCPDRQRYDIGRFCLRASSLYFACLATGNSRMYESTALAGFAEAAGLRVERLHEDLGLSLSLFECRPAAAAGPTPPAR